MTKDDAGLLRNLFDSLDQLFDRESSVIDVYALLGATEKALSSSARCAVLVSYIDSLDVIVRSCKSDNAQREQVLISPENLRGVLNELLRPR